MSKPSEQGAALLSVLLLVAIMGALSAAALERLRLSTRLTTNGMAIEQARAYAMGAEAIAILHVADLTPKDVGITTLDSNWKNHPITTPIKGGTMTVTLDDGGNCFNLNSVVQGTSETNYTARQLGVTQFIALMLQVGISPSDARVIAASLVDWIDTDAVPNPEGAEDAFYRNQPVPYRTANTILADPSELRAVRGVTADIYDRLRPWICALPVTDLSPINVNTLGADQAPLLVMLMPGLLDLGHARSMLNARPKGGWTSIDQFWKMPALAAITPDMNVQGQVQLKTRWYMLDLDVKVMDTQVNEIALIDGVAKPARIVFRRWGSDE